MVLRGPDLEVLVTIALFDILSCGVGAWEGVEGPEGLSGAGKVAESSTT